MLKKDKILKEILENDPSLVSKKKQLKNLIDLLVENNPDIKIDKKFKENLRSKLDVIISNNNEDDDKVIKKLSIFTGIINAISVAFIIGGFYYLISNVDFFDDSNINNDNTYEEIGTEESYEDNNSKQIEDNQLIDILGDGLIEEKKIERIQVKEAVGLEIQESSLLMQDEVKPDIDLMINSDDVEVNISVFEESVVEEILDFKTFCSNSNGDLLNIDGNKICIVENKICKEEDFIEQKCEFVDIK